MDVVLSVFAFDVLLVVTYFIFFRWEHTSGRGGACPWRSLCSS